MSAAETFVIWTRYESPKGTIVRHVYGPYPTRAKAQTVVRRMKHDHFRYFGNLSGTDISVTKLLSGGDER